MLRRGEQEGKGREKRGEGREEREEREGRARLTLPGFFNPLLSRPGTPRVITTSELLSRFGLVTGKDDGSGWRAEGGRGSWLTEAKTSVKRNED